MKIILETRGKKTVCIRAISAHDAVATWLAEVEAARARGTQRCESLTVTVHADGEDCDHELPEPLSVVGSAQRKGTG